MLLDPSRPGATTSPPGRTLAVTELPQGFRCHVANVGVKDDTDDFVVIAADEPGSAEVVRRLLALAAGTDEPEPARDPGTATQPDPAATRPDSDGVSP